MCGTTASSCWRWWTTCGRRASSTAISKPPRPAGEARVGAKSLYYKKHYFFILWNLFYFLLFALFCIVFLSSLFASPLPYRRHLTVTQPPGKKSPSIFPTNAHQRFMFNVLGLKTIGLVIAGMMETVISRSNPNLGWVAVRRGAPSRRTSWSAATASSASRTSATPPAASGPGGCRRNPLRATIVSQLIFFDSDLVIFLIFGSYVIYITGKSPYLENATKHLPIFEIFWRSRQLKPSLTNGFSNNKF